MAALELAQYTTDLAKWKTTPKVGRGTKEQKMMLNNLLQKEKWPVSLPFQFAHAHNDLQLAACLYRANNHLLSMCHWVDNFQTTRHTCFIYAVEYLCVFAPGRIS